MVGAITPWNFPHQINFAKLGPALAAGLHRGAQAGARHAVVRLGGRSHRGGAHRPARRGAQRRHLVGPLVGRAARGRPPGRRGVVHRFDRHRSRGHALARRRTSPGSSWSWAASPRSWSSTTPTWPPPRRHGGVRGQHPRRPGLCHHHPAAGATCRARRGGRGRCGHHGRPGAGDPTDPGTICGPVISARQRERIEGYLQSALDEGGSFAVRRRPLVEVRARVLHRPDAGRGAGQLRQGGPGGDLRSGPDRASPTTATTTPSRSPTTRPSGCPARSSPADEERALAVRRPHPDRDPEHQRWRLVRRRRALRRLQAVRHRSGDGRRRLRGVPRDQGRRDRASESRADDRRTRRDERDAAMSGAVGFIGLGNIGAPMARRDCWRGPTAWWCTTCGPRPASPTWRRARRRPQPRRRSRPSPT